VTMGSMTTTNNPGPAWSWVEPDPTSRPTPHAELQTGPPTHQAFTQASATVAKTVSTAWGGAPSLGLLFPIRAWWASKEWQRGAPLLFLVFGLAPWVILHAVGFNDSISKAAWGFSLYFAVLWALGIWALIRPGKPDLALVAKVVVASAVFGIPFAIWLEKAWGHGSSLAVYVLGVGFPEELAKALPVFFLMVIMAEKRTYSTRMFMYIGALSGLAFGVVEAVKYSPGYAAQLAQGQATALVATETVWRLLTDGLFHAATAAITCYFIGLAAKNLRWRVQLIIVGLALTSVLHGMNDRYSQGWTQVGIAGAILFIFIGYVLTGDSIAAEVESENGHSPA
jgi:RsiW-degrading membrane proteinase PrsW (M82 family)